MISQMRWVLAWEAIVYSNSWMFLWDIDVWEASQRATADDMQFSHGRLLWEKSSSEILT
jgi:hypothetical protein